MDPAAEKGERGQRSVSLLLQPEDLQQHQVMMPWEAGHRSGERPEQL